MFSFVLPFPVIPAEIISFGSFSIRWYAIAYIAGLFLGWKYIHKIVQKGPWGNIRRPIDTKMEDLLFYTALGTIIGGRLGNILFYGFEYYWENPIEIFSIWKGGMAFHGGLIGVVLAIYLFSRWHKENFLTIADLCSAAVPIGLGLGRLANFIKPELWGRETSVAWGIIFPGAGPFPRHPSQLYEALLEGLLLFIFLNWAIKKGALKRPGLITGLFSFGYGIARIFSEFFRDPDPQLEMLNYGLTMGMILSFPLVLIGLLLILNSYKSLKTLHD